MSCDFKVFCDGSYFPGTNCGGCGAAIVGKKGFILKFSRSFFSTDSFVSELKTILSVIEFFDKQKDLLPCKILIHTDCKLFERSLRFTKTNSSANKIIRQIKKVQHLSKHLFYFKWLKSHSGHLLNNLAHRTAYNSAKNRLLNSNSNNDDFICSYELN